MNTSSPNDNKFTTAIKTCALLTALLLGFTFQAFAGWQSGSALPDLGSFGLEGRLPSELKGKVILLDFWAAWCGPCRASFPVLERLHRQYADQGLVVIAVNQDDTQAAMDKFLKNNPVTFTVVRDASHKLIGNADVKAMPTSFIIDRTGAIRHVHSGFHGEKTAAQYVTEIEALLKEGK